MLDNFQIVLSVRLFLVKNSMGAVPTTITVTRGLHIFLDTDRGKAKLLGCHITGQHLYCMHLCHPWPSYEVLNFLTSSAAGFVTACCVVVVVHAGLVESCSSLSLCPASLATLGQCVLMDFFNPPG